MVWWCVQQESNKKKTMARGKSIRYATQLCVNVILCIYTWNHISQWNISRMHSLNWSLVQYVSKKEIVFGIIDGDLEMEYKNLDHDNETNVIMYFHNCTTSSIPKSIKLMSDRNTTG